MKNGGNGRCRFLTWLIEWGIWAVQFGVCPMEGLLHTPGIIPIRPPLQGQNFDSLVASCHVPGSLPKLEACAWTTCGVLIVGLSTRIRDQLHISMQFQALIPGIALPLYPSSHSFNITMPSTRPQENEIQTLVKAGTFEIPPVVPTTAFKEIKRYQSNLNDVLGTADPPPYSKHSPGKHDPTRPRNSSRTFKKWLKNLRHSPNQSQGENAPRSLNGSRYQSVIILIPEGYEYPIYNLDAKLGEREGNTSIEFQCSACSDGQSYFRRISVEIQLFHLSKWFQRMSCILLSNAAFQIKEHR